MLARKHVMLVLLTSHLTVSFVWFEFELTCMRVVVVLPYSLGPCQHIIRLIVWTHHPCNFMMVWVHHKSVPRLQSHYNMNHVLWNHISSMVFKLIWIISPRLISLHSLPLLLCAKLWNHASPPNIILICHTMQLYHITLPYDSIIWPQAHLPLYPCLPLSLCKNIMFSIWYSIHFFVVCAYNVLLPLLLPLRIYFLVKYFS